MYYIEHKSSDSIELQEGTSLNGVLDRASSLSGKQITSLDSAILELNKHGYIVFEDAE
jgi:hypothetical protein